MTAAGNVVDFASRRHRGAARGGDRTVARMAEALSRGMTSRRKPDGVRTLRIRLDLLCGVADDTVERLGCLVAKRVLTPESAARLAVRHANEIGLWTGSRPPKGESAPARFDLNLASKTVPSFAFRIGSSGDAPWVGSARASAIEGLLDACPVGGRGICLLVGESPSGRPFVRMVTTPDWQSTLIARSCRPGWKRIRDLVVVGNLPALVRQRAAIFCAIEDFLRRRPGLRLLTSQAHLFRKANAEPGPTAIQILSFIEIALPGLLRSDDGGKP